jgi:hypothetical protein
MSRRTIDGVFSSAEEYLLELRLDKELVERGIVRITKVGRPDATGARTFVTVEASAIIEGRVVRFARFIGSLWGVESQDEPVQRRVTELVERLEAGIGEIGGLTTRSGEWQGE